MSIKMQLSPESIDAAITKLEAFQETLEEKCGEFTRRLGEIGLEVIRAAYVGASYAGTNDIEVHLEFEESKCKIVANGSALGFIEFGTGVAYPLGEYAAQVNAPPHGSYGQKRGATGKKWVYKGDAGNIGEPDPNRTGLVWTKGNPPADAFPKGVEAIKAEVETIAKEVFVFD